MAKPPNETIDMDFLNVTNLNWTKHWHLEEEQAASPAMIALFLVSLILIIFVGCPIFLSIVHFEHFGNDPQKRRLSNMILTNLCIFSVIEIMLWYMLLTLRIIFGPLYHTLVEVWLGITIFMTLGFDISLLIGIALKNLEMIMPKFALSLNDNFGYLLLTAVTIMFEIFATAYFSFTLDQNPYYHPFIGETSHIHFEIPHVNPVRSVILFSIKVKLICSKKPIVSVLLKSRLKSCSL